MECSRCHTEKCIEVSRGKDGADNLDHSRMKCPKCEYEFNHWNESKKILQRVFGDSYEIYQ